MGLVWELDDVYKIIITDELDISLDLFLISADHISDTVNILLSSLTTMAISMMTWEMRIVMPVGVSSEMMMIDSQEMYQLYSRDQ